ncbi:hypothetical protein [Enterobacter hormaechei]|uniref:hypothetical protein n=1 Tax=Enterobacter hormaechei TaxID=158836 RepID=UPI0013FE1D2B|nr:hypothetical protein [Enterobacter hormaechei]
MKLLNVIEALLNCLYLAAELWDWLEKHLPVFKALALILVWLYTPCIWLHGTVANSRW